MRRLPVVFSLVIVCLCCTSVVAAAEQRWDTRPETVLRGVAYAIDNADAALFESLVDVQAITRQGVAELAAKARTPEGQKALPPALGMIFSSASGHLQAVDTIGSLFASEAQAFVRYGIASGKFGGTVRSGVQPSGMLANLFAGASMGRKEIRDIGAARYADNKAYVSCSVFDHGNGNSYPIDAMLEQRNHAWVMTQIANMASLLDILNREAVQ